MLSRMQCERQLESRIKILHKAESLRDLLNYAECEKRAE